MKTATFGTISLFAAALVLQASEGFATEPAEKGERETVAQLFTYKAPLRGAPATRVGGGSRSADATISLDVLAPDHTGHTLQERPAIYWYVSRRIESPVEVTITPLGGPLTAFRPLLELTLAPPIERGVHAVRLQDHGVTLKSETEYQWFVAVVRDPDQRSRDILAGGSIKRIGASKALESRLSEADESTRAAVFAESGVWYDAIDELSRLISANPSNDLLRAQRAALLESVGLHEAAAHDYDAGG